MPTQLVTANSDGSDREMPIVFVSGTFELLKDMIFTGLELIGVLILGAVGVAGLAYGLYTGGWL